MLKRYQPNTREGLARWRPDLITLSDAVLDGSVLGYVKNTQLFILQELTNQDKHRVLPLLITGIAQAIYKRTEGHSLGIDCEVGATKVYGPHALELGAVWSEYDVVPTGPNPRVNVQDEITPAVAFEHGRPVQGVIPAIGAIVVEMVREFEQFF
jgi:hypothetical protein